MFWNELYGIMEIVAIFEFFILYFYWRITLGTEVMKSPKMNIDFSMVRGQFDFFADGDFADGSTGRNVGDTCFTLEKSQFRVFSNAKNFKTYSKINEKSIIFGKSFKELMRFFENF